MKYYYILLSLTFLHSVTCAQTIANGYYVSLSNDTVKAEIKVPKMIFGAVDVERLERRLKAVDSTGGGFEKFKLNEIKAFGFTYKEKEYNYASKHLKGNGNKFLEQVLSGSKASLYSYYITGVHNIKHYTYIVSRPNGDETILRNTMSRRKMKKKLKELFQNEANAEVIIDSSAIKYRHLATSLKEILESVNNS